MRRNRGYGITAGLLPLLACVLSGASPARAAEGEEAAEVVNPIEIGVFGGIHVYEKDHGLGRYLGDDTLYSPDTGGAFGLRLTYNINKWVGVELEGMFSPTRTRDDSMRENILGYRGQVIATFLHEGYVRPFALIGYGALSSFPEFTNRMERDTDGMIHLGIGAKFPLSEMFGLRLDGRVMAPPAIASDIVEVGSETHYGGPDFEALLSAYVGLGGEKAAPPPPPPPPPPPDPDPDKDGILGDKDKCPNDAEDKDNFEDEDGCPDLDNDNDGVPDTSDKCQLEPEDKDGFEDEDGCPEADNDGDGITDTADKCPNEPETKNNYQDADGCPDEIPAEVAKFTGVIEGINFRTNSAKIAKSSSKVLDKAIKVLTDYPDVKLEIGGHTDNVGKAEYNLELSQKRADAVKDYMVGKGIAADRLTSVGYGMDKPITSNKTKADRAKNRRTEFTLVGEK
ncbi:MAG: OmpA family protein [Deltaproteobacteria bacterium]|nr:OmpA family protein [Deltaproteobacteria bacterium]